MPDSPSSSTAVTCANVFEASPLVARRSFLRYSGAGLAVGGLVLAGCTNEDTDVVSPNNKLLDVGTGDTGVLNYAYALKQLEAAFYAQVVAGKYFKDENGAAGPKATDAEKAILSDLKDHEAIHAAFLKSVLGSAAIKDLTPDFSGIDFSQRTTAPGASKLGVLSAAMAFEDLGVAAYNGVARIITSADYLALIGKIVSVEARHAAVIRELITANTFVASDVVDTTTTGLEKSKRPAVVLATVNAFLAAGSRLSASKLFV